MQNWTMRVREWWLNQDPRGRLVVVGGTLVAFVLVIGLAFWAGAPQYEVLYTDLSPADSAAVVSKLKEQGTPVRVRGNGSIIEVPAQVKEEARLQLAAQGLPRTGAPGYSRLEKSAFGMTQEMEQNTVRIALEEELQNTIQSLEPVESARVHITLGDDSPFADSKREATASVVVNLQPGAVLTREQIRGIVHLVSYSVEGLAPEKVSIVDGGARPLWDGSQDTANSSLVNTRREAERTYAEELRRSIQQQLDGTLGPGKATVMVHAELNLDQEEIQSQRVQPEGGQGPVISETTSEETLNGSAPVPGGAAGIGSNAPLYSTGSSGAGGGPGKYTRTDETRNFELNKDITHTIKAPGRIERLSVAVLVDESVSDADVSKIQTMLETAIGVSRDTPGRQVTCQKIAFDKQAVDSKQKEMERLAQARRMELLWRWLPVFLLLLVAFFLVRSLSKQIAQSRPPVRAPIAAITAGGESTFEVSVGETGIETLPSVTAGEAMASEESQPGKPLPFEGPVEPELVQLRKLSKERPDRVALLLKNWMENE